ncbi:rare lipoprotein A (RlpA-like double-psi [Streptomyces acidiscabies]|nr:rare lipoprotein A (RlpA-like double-psi [Streptomyces acidiscabies]GAV42505.1 rare lipoprotein A (RlpA-like double-psi [Streptomyces acidiscabies]
MKSFRRVALVGSALLACVALAPSAAGRDAGWNSATATFYGGADASGTMGGACGYGNLYDRGIGIMSTAVSTALFNDGAACGARYKVRCAESRSSYCIPGAEVTVTVTNLCPPNWALPSNNGGWCNPPRQHFDLSQPAFEKIAKISAGIAPIEYSEADTDRNTPLKFTMNGRDFFNLVLVDSNSRWGTKQVLIKGSRTSWLPMTRNWGANWQSLESLRGQSLSFRVTDTHNRTVTATNVIPANWSYGLTYAAPGF